METVRRAFPTLRDIPDYKIEFAVLPRKGMSPNGPLISILDDAWGAMVTSAPEAMLVSVRESPEELSRRESLSDRRRGVRADLIHVFRIGNWHEWMQTLAVIAFGVGVPALVITTLWWCDSMRYHQKPSYTAVQNSDIERGPQGTTQDDTVRSDDDQDQEK